MLSFHQTTLMQDRPDVTDVRYEDDFTVHDWIPWKPGILFLCSERIQHRSTTGRNRRGCKGANLPSCQAKCKNRDPI